MVTYNVQTAVDWETHMIEDYLVTGHVTDHGMIGETVAGIKREAGERVIDAVTDKSYNEPKDIVACLEEGIIPNVILPGGKDVYELEVSYEEAGSGAEERTDRIKRILRAGDISEKYKGIIESAEVKAKRVFMEDGTHDVAIDPYGSEEEMKERTGEGYFVRDPERNLVYYPAGEVLKQKSIKKNRDICYANMAACRHCKNRNKCYKGKNEWKEIDFNKDILGKSCKEWMEAEGKEAGPEQKAKRGHYEVKKIVKLVC